MDTSQLAHAARQASRLLSTLDNRSKNAALERIAAALASQSEKIFTANRRDLDRSAAEGLAAPLQKRLIFDARKLEEVICGLRDLIGLPDPVGHTLLATRLDTGLDLYRVSCPIGVIGVIFESRPDALVQISGLCLKSGNAVLLKGGSEAWETNRVLADIIDDASRTSASQADSHDDASRDAASQAAGLPAGWIGLLETRADVDQLLAMDQDVDLLIPRGSNAFVRYIKDHTRIPVLGHADGVCHLYIDKSCDPEMAIRLAIDSKTQYVAVCNAVETILLHADLADSLLQPLADALRRAHVEIRGCERTCSRLDGCLPVDGWHTEYLDYKVSVKLVDSLDEAIGHINRHGSGHTDAIVTGDQDAARRFLQEVDSGNVFWNCSTRFSDGFKYGFGAEVGISTSKIHARGPVGLEGLLTYQYRLLGQGQSVADYACGQRSFQHEPIAREYPLQPGQS